jgi:hypothetical protein
MRLRSGVLVTRDPGGYHATYSTPVSLRPYRPGVEPTCSVASVPREARAPTKMASTPHRRCSVLPTALWLRLADAAPGVSTLANSLLPLSKMAPGRPVAPSPRAAASSSAPGGRTQPRSKWGGEIDSQAVKGSGVGGPERGYDGAKRLSGRKRYLSWWTPTGWCSVHKSMAASLHDRDGGHRGFSTTSWPRSCPG